MNLVGAIYSVSKIYLSSETRILAMFNGWLIGPDNDPLDDWLPAAKGI